jgi:cobalt-zinc-cadmium resistance protein CzcA
MSIKKYYNQFRMSVPINVTKAMLTFLLLSTAVVFAQQTGYTVEQAVSEAVKNNAGFQAVRWEEKQVQQLKKTAFEMPKTNFSWMSGQYNGYPSDNNFTVTQTIPFMLWGSQAALNRSLATSAELKRTSSEIELTYQVKSVFYQLAFTKVFRAMLMKQDSTLAGFANAAAARYRTGEGTLLEKTTAETQRNEMTNRLNKNLADSHGLQAQLQALLNTNSTPDIDIMGLPKLSWTEATDTNAIRESPMMQLARQQMDVAASAKKVERAKLGPELMIGYFNQTLTGSIDPENGTIASGSDRFSGFQVGVGLPLFFGAQQARAKAAGFNQEAANSHYQQQRNTLFSQWQQAILQYNKSKAGLAYYETSAIPNAELILKQASAAYRQGEIGTSEFLLQLRQVLSIQESHLTTLNEYNQTILYLEFLSAKK